MHPIGSSQRALRSKKGEGRPPTGWATLGMGRFSPAEVIGTTCGPYNGRAVSGIAWRVCTRHATSGMGPSLPACFPSWRRAMIPLPSESASRVYTRDEISGMEDADGPAKVRTSVPRVHAGRCSRHGLAKAERFPCRQEVLPSTLAESPSHVYTRDGISGMSPDGQLSANVYTQGHGPPNALSWPTARKEDWNPRPLATGPDAARATTPVGHPFVFSELYSPLTRQLGRDFKVSMSRGTLDSQGEEKGRPRDGMTLGLCPPLADPPSTIGSSINAQAMAAACPREHS